MRDGVLFHRLGRGQARAKVELREHVTEQDAKDVVDMMQEVSPRSCTMFMTRVLLCTTRKFSFHDVPSG